MRISLATAAACLFAITAGAQAPPPSEAPVGRKLIEIYRVAPGQHEAFLRAIAQCDEANRRAGVPPRQLYVHSDGASWDFLLIQDAEYPEGKGALVDKAFEDLRLPTGARFFIDFRRFILEHTDTFASGPTTASAYLATLHATRPAVPLGGGLTLSYELRKSIPLGGTPRWDYLTVDPAARRVYVAHDVNVEVVDLDEQRVVGQVRGLAGAHGIALAPEMGRGFVASGDRNLVTAFSLETLQHLGVAKVGRGPDSVTFEPVTRSVLAWNGDSQNVTILDAGSLRVVHTVPLGGTPEFAVADGAGSVFVNIEETHEIVTVDAGRGVVAARRAIAGCDEPTGLAFDATARRLFSACSNATLVSVDAATGARLGSAPIGRGADAVVWDESRGIVFVSSSEGFVSLVEVGQDGSLRSLAAVQTRVTGRTMALDPATGAIYVPAADLDIDWDTRAGAFARDGLKLHVFEPVRR
ncbi:MAG TPA: YncE family protein [Vicinamibacterales bacterium]|nr:YncE family protein [Vicinamibacterales bacterium]HOQ61699.1 YncE family protein [Vicinamibacterales bacterium]